MRCHVSHAPKALDRHGHVVKLFPAQDKGFWDTGEGGRVDSY